MVNREASQNILESDHAPLVQRGSGSAHEDDRKKCRGSIHPAMGGTGLEPVTSSL